MNICVVVLNLFMPISIILYIILYYNLYIYVYPDLVYHYCVSNILQRIKTVNKIWWYKLRLSKLCVQAKYNLKPKMYIVVIWLSSYSSFFFLFTFYCFSSVSFLLFFDVFCTPPHNQENHDSKYIPFKYDANTRLIERSVNWEKTLILACAWQPYTLKLLDHILNILEFLTVCYVQRF